MHKAETLVSGRARAGYVHGYCKSLVGVRETARDQHASSGTQGTACGWGDGPFGLDKLASGAAGSL